MDCSATVVHQNIVEFISQFGIEHFAMPSEQWYFGSYEISDANKN